MDVLRLPRSNGAEPAAELDVPPGLAGVVVAATAIGDVRGAEGFFHYRQYSAAELARVRTFEDVWHLLIAGELPDAGQRAAFTRHTAGLRAVPPSTAELLPAIARAATNPVDGLRTAVSLVGAELGFRPILDLSGEELQGQTLRLAAVTPTLAMALYRHAAGLDPVEPDAALGYAANFLWMLTGAQPDADFARALEQYLIATIDHGFNASTFTARVITSTGADLAAAATGAIGALSGPLHGGAPSRALGLLEEIGSHDRAREVVRSKIEQGQRIMGFGHRVYKTRDPRSELLREVALRLGGPRAELAARAEDAVVEVLAELKPGRQLYANVEYYAGVVFEQIGLPPELFTPTFVCSRMVGWGAHILEQSADNRLIRPAARYAGPPPPQPVPALG